MTFEINLLGVLAYAKDWDYDEYYLTALPIVNFGIGHKFKKHLVTLCISYVPENNSISGTSGTDLLFFHVSVLVTRGYKITYDSLSTLMPMNYFNEVNSSTSLLRSTFPLVDLK